MRVGRSRHRHAARETIRETEVMRRRVLRLILIVLAVAGVAAYYTVRSRAKRSGRSESRLTVRR